MILKLLAFTLWFLAFIWILYCLLFKIAILLFNRSVKNMGLTGVDQVQQGWTLILTFQRLSFQGSLLKQTLPFYLNQAQSNVTTVFNFIVKLWKYCLDYCKENQGMSKIQHNYSNSAPLTDRKALSLTNYPSPCSPLLTKCIYTHRGQDTDHYW